MAKKKTAEKALNIDNILFNCRDYLRAARNSGSFFEKRDMMLTLVFLRFIGEKYEDGIENLKQTLKEQGFGLHFRWCENKIRYSTYTLRAFLCLRISESLVLLDY